MQLLPEFTNAQGEHFHTSRDAAEAMLAHFAATKGGYLVEPDWVV
jgi:hypothetical protein